MPADERLGAGGALERPDHAQPAVARGVPAGHAVALVPVDPHPLDAEAGQPDVEVRHAGLDVAPGPLDVDRLAAQASQSSSALAGESS